MRFKSLVFSFAMMLLIQPMVALIKSQDKNKCSTNCCGSHGIPGVPGVPGGPGRDGTPGPKGDIGSTGPVGPKGEPGNKGSDGLDRKGNIGPKGDIGSGGPVGPKGEPGNKGSDGLDLNTRSNWKQCAWKREDDKDNGLIQSCIFEKKHDNTSLRVFYGGTLRIYNCNSCCKRWYFTFDGAECSKPMAIDGVVYMEKGAGAQLQNLLRHRHIEGYCNQVPKGHVRVGFWVGNCAGYGNADAYSGWKSVSRIVIEEVPPPQA